MILDNIWNFIRGEKIITLSNPEDLKKFRQEYDAKYKNYRHITELTELLEAKEQIAFYPFYILISGRFNKRIETWHEKNSKLYVSGVNG